MKCTYCDKRLDGKWKTKFCNRSCAASWNNQGRTVSAATRRKQSKGVAKHWKDPVAVRRHRKGIAASVRVKDQHDAMRVYKQCPECQATYYGQRVYCSVSCSKTGRGRKAAVQGNNGRGKRGTYKGLHYQSSWELAFIKWALRSGKAIKRCSEYVPYTYEGVRRLYNPDFVIGRTVYEIKGYFTPQVNAKIRAARRRFKHFKVIGPEQIAAYL